MRRRLLSWLLGVLGCLALGSVVATAQELSTAAPVLDQLSREALDRGLATAERLAAVRALGEWRTAQVVPTLTALLDDPDADIRAQAALGLAWEGNEGAVGRLLARLAASGEAPLVRRAVVRALGATGSAESRESLLAALHDPSPEVRSEAASALAWGPLRSSVDRVPVLIAHLLDDGATPNSRTRAAKDLGEAGDARAVPALLEALQTGPPAGPAPAPVANPSRADIMRARARFHSDVRAWSADALGRLGDARALPALVAALDDKDDDILRAKAATALALLGGADGVPALIHALRDPVLSVRYAAVAGLARLKARDAVFPLLVLLSEEDLQLRLLAIRALAMIGDTGAVGSLQGMATVAAEPEVRAAAEQAVERLRGAR